MGCMRFRTVVVVRRTQTTSRSSAFPFFRADYTGIEGLHHISGCVPAASSGGNTDSLLTTNNPHLLMHADVVPNAVSRVVFGNVNLAFVLMKCVPRGVTLEETTTGICGSCEFVPGGTNGRTCAGVELTTVDPRCRSVCHDLVVLLIIHRIDLLVRNA